MVGKSNKFDFSNRSNHGVTLAKVISDAFEKELEKAKKDAARQARKVTKQGVAIDASKDISVHVIDLKVPFKELGDNGINTMVHGIGRALSGGTHEASLSLQHINLQGNDLTLAGCHGLESVLYATAGTMKTLDLSENDIRVESEQDMCLFEQFSLALIKLHPKCKVDLSGNKQLGSRAWEVFARVCAQEHVHRNCLENGFAGANTDSEPTDTPAKNESEGHDAAQSSTTRRASNSLVADGGHLPGIPCINIANTGLDDAGALWLSYTLPSDIYTACTTTPATTDCDDRIETSSTRPDWRLAGSALGKDGLQLLCWVDDITSRSKSNDIQSTLHVESLQNVPRRASGRHSVSTKVNANDVIVLRHRMQRQVIQQLGVKHVQLWQLAMSAITTSRKLSMLFSSKLQRHPGLDPNGPHDIRPIVKLQDKPNSSQSAPRVLRIMNAAQNGSKRCASPTSSTLTDVSNTTIRHMHNDGQQCTNNENGKPITAISTRIRSIALAAGNGDLYRRWQEERLKAQPYGDELATCGLPPRLFRRIFELSANCDWPTNKLNTVQLRKTYYWGQSRVTLALEREWIRMTDSAQILTLLGNVNCLDYVV